MSTSENTRIGVIVTLSALSFVLNGTFLVVVCKNWTLVKRRRITYHVTNLAIADSIVGASTFFSYISVYAAAGRQTMLNSVFITIALTACLTSLLAVCLMAIERTVCIKKPHTWNQILPLKRILIIMAGNWVLTLALVVLVYFFTLIMRFVVVVLVYIPIFVTTVLYINVYLKIKKATSNEVHDETHQNSSEAINRRQKKLMQQKVGNFVLILTVVMLITTTPLVLTITAMTTCELFELNCKFIGTVMVLDKYVFLLGIVNFVVNPIFYVWRLSMYRKAFWRMFGRVDSENS